MERFQIKILKKGSRIWNSYSAFPAFEYIRLKTDLIFMSFMQNVLRELELKKPQLDELMQTAESLKSESNRHNLHVKGKAQVMGVWN